MGPGPPPPRGFYITLNDAPQSVGLLWTSDQFVAETSTWQQTTLTTDIHATGGIRTHNLNRRAVADLRLSPRGYWDPYVLQVVTSVADESPLLVRLNALKREAVAYFGTLISCITRDGTAILIFTVMKIKNLVRRIHIFYNNVNWESSLALLFERLSSAKFSVLPSKKLRR